MTQQEPGRNRKPNDADKSAAAAFTRNLPRLFVEFQQLDATMAKKYAGTGLGSALTKSVETQGRRVGVKSAPDTGNLLYAVLPRIFTQSTAGIGKRSGMIGASRG
jgi:light-regulated signal transduction histidine kinase (bacteriophytochrome)